MLLFVFLLPFTLVNKDYQSVSCPRKSRGGVVIVAGSASVMASAMADL